MTTVDRINQNVQHLPAAIQQEVLDFVEFLIQKGQLRKNGLKADTRLQKAASIELWANGHSYATPVILDDRRETIYED